MPLPISAPSAVDRRARSFVFALLLGLSLATSRAELPAGFLIRSWQSEDGLPGNVVRSVSQAADGYLWVATAEGTVRFDGLRFTGFDVADAALARLPPRALFTMANGDVWVATVRGGLLRWREGRLTSVWADAPDALPVTQVVAEEDRAVLIVRGEEVWRASFSVSPVRIERLPVIDDILRKDSEAAMRRGRALGGATLGSNPLRLEDARGRIWTTTPDGGLKVAYGNAGAHTALPELEQGIRINELHEDREGNIWAATGESGLVQMRDRRVEVLTSDDGLSDKTARVLLEDSRGALWVGGKRGGLDRLENGQATRFEVGDPRASRPVTSVYEDRSGMFWAATRDGSVFRLEDGTFRPFLNVPTGVTKVRAIGEDQQGRMWFAGVQGLAMWSSGALTRIGAKEGFAPSEVTVLASDAAESLWIGTSRGAVWRRKADRYEQQAIDASSGGRAVSALLPDSDGGVWATTLGAGLLHIHGGRATHFGVAHGLPELRLTCVLDDGLGNLWLGSLAGIFRVSKLELAEIENGQRTTAHWLKVDRSDGLLSSECSGGSQPAGWKGRDGRLWFPMVRGVAVIRPDQLALNSVPPPVAIESCETGEATFIGASPVRAGPGRARLEFRYTALSFAAPEKVRFRLRLEGLETEWRDIGAERVASYPAVPPGRYRFHVAAANGDGVWNEADASVSVVVSPHFWETSWFRALAICAAVTGAAGVGWALARARLRRRLARLHLQHARESERARIARDLHDDLGASLTEISMLANLAVEDGASSAALREPLTQIAGKAHSLVGALDEIVWAVNPRQDTVASLVDYLAAFAGEFLTSAGIALRLDVERQLPHLALHSERRHGLFLAVREALNNAVKHSAASEVSLRARVLESRLEITVRDNGSGFTADSGERGEGLRNIGERLRSFGGEYRIESAQGAGTSVHLSLPLSSSARMIPA